MSFKVKRWARWRTVNMSDRIAGIKSTGSTASYFGGAYPWQGKILVLAYAADNSAIYAIYDPVTESVAGPYSPPAGISSWNFSSPTWGARVHYTYWHNQYFYAAGNPSGYYYGSSDFFGWDAGFDMFRQPHPSFEAGTNQWTSQYNAGSNGSVPTVLSYATNTTYRRIVRRTPTGYEVVRQIPYEFGGDNFQFPISGGLNVLSFFDIGPYIAWSYDGRMRLYTSPPVGVVEAEAYLGTIEPGLAATVSGSRPSNGMHVCDPSGSGSWVYIDTGAGGAWRNSADPLSPADRGFYSWWDYYRLMDGGFTLDNYDLDGSVTYGEAGITSFPLSSTSPVSRNEDTGWYVAIANTASNVSFVVWVLDPVQPAGLTPAKRAHSGTGWMGWAGDYALHTTLELAHVLPLKGRGPSGGSRPPQERKDGWLVGERELFKVAGSELVYKRPISIDLSSYPTDDPDWWFPNAAGDRHAGFWGIFAGTGPTLVGYMPDPSWGMYTPLGQYIGRYLGVATETFEGEEPAATHKVTHAGRLSTTNWAAPLAGAQYQRAQLVSSLDGKTFCYSAWGPQTGSMMRWAARAGEFDGATWTPIADLESIDMPDLGQTNWTVKSLSPVPKCRTLPDGGFLVGATLYFDPWAEYAWEWTPGARAHTFRFKSGEDSGQGWVPAVPGYIGPLQIDRHEPRYLTALDEWTTNRSLYGPDALLVFDREFNFVDCLNDWTMHAPNGAECFVTDELLPRLVFRIYRHGTYSDFAEGFGVYHRIDTDHELQAPLYAVYDLFGADGQIQRGAGTFRGFFNMHAATPYAAYLGAWRWNVPLYVYDTQYPKLQWSPPGETYVRAGTGGSQITILKPRQGHGRAGVKGVGGRA